MVNFRYTGCPKNRPDGILFRNPCLKAEDVAADDHESESQSLEMGTGAYVQANTGAQRNAGFLGALLEAFDERDHHGGKSVPELAIK